MACEQLALRTPEGVSSLAEQWCDATVSSADAERIAKAAIKCGVGQTQKRATGCLDGDADLCVGAIIWLKNRLADFALLPPGHCGCPRIRLFCELHFEPLHIAASEIASWCFPPNYARSRISRSPLARIEPIDRVASRLTQFSDESKCPYCNRYYRNGAALRLHAVESHGVSA